MMPTIISILQHTCWIVFLFTIRAYWGKMIISYPLHLFIFNVIWHGTPPNLFMRWAIYIKSQTTYFLFITSLRQQNVMKTRAEYCVFHWIEYHHHQSYDDLKGVPPIHYHMICLNMSAFLSFVELKCFPRNRNEFISVKYLNLHLSCLRLPCDYKNVLKYEIKYFW